MLSNKDDIFMQRAIELAKKGIYNTSPNPNVGCVIVKDGLIIGEGYHQKAGLPHAEIYALEMAADEAIGADLYVTLEPCSHFGKTPPCTEKIIQSKIKRVIVGMQDPYHEVCGQGIEKLRSAGIEVILGCLESAVENLNLGFISRIKRNKPWVTMKIAASLDGKTALLNGKSQWITGHAARTDVHYLRAKSDVIVTGSGTVLADNPHMTVRDIDIIKHPNRLVIDRQLKTDPTANIYNNDSRVILVTLSNNNRGCGQFETLRGRYSYGRRRDARSVACWRHAMQRATQYSAIRISQNERFKLSTAPDKLFDFKNKNVDIWDDLEIDNTISLEKLLYKLSIEKINYILIEAGMNLNAEFLKKDLVDELIVYLAPSILGDKAFGMFNLPELKDLNQKFQFYFHQIEQLDADIKLTLRRKNLNYYSGVVS